MLESAPRPYYWETRTPEECRRINKAAISWYYREMARLRYENARQANRNRPEKPTSSLQPRSLPLPLKVTHERMVQVMGYLSDFAVAYPELSEGERQTYRDLCRAAMVSLDDEQKAESMLLGRSVDELLFRACREDVGAWLLRRLRQMGLFVRLVTEGSLRLQVGPREKLTPAISAKVKRWKQALRDALLTEGLNDPAILQAKRA